MGTPEAIKVLLIPAAFGLTYYVYNNVYNKKIKSLSVLFFLCFLVFNTFVNW